MNNINTLSKQGSQINRASGVWGSMGAGKPLKTSQTPITSPQGDQTYSIGIPESQRNRLEDILNSGLSDGPKPYDLLRVRGKSAVSIKYTIEPASEGFFNFVFHDMDRETFYRVVTRLNQQGIETIGADTELSEDTIELNKKSMDKLHKTGKMKKDDHTIKFIREFIQKEFKRLKELHDDDDMGGTEFVNFFDVIARSKFGKDFYKLDDNEQEWVENENKYNHKKYLKESHKGVSIRVGDSVLYKGNGTQWVPSEVKQVIPPDRMHIEWNDEYIEVHKKDVKPMKSGESVSE